MRGRRCRLRSRRLRAARQSRGSLGHPAGELGGNRARAGRRPAPPRPPRQPRESRRGPSPARPVSGARAAPAGIRQDHAEPPRIDPSRSLSIETSFSTGRGGFRRASWRRRPCQRPDRSSDSRGGRAARVPPRPGPCRPAPVETSQIAAAKAAERREPRRRAIAGRPRRRGRAGSAAGPRPTECGASPSPQRRQSSARDLSEVTARARDPGHSRECKPEEDLGFGIQDSGAGTRNPESADPEDPSPRSPGRRSGRAPASRFGGRNPAPSARGPPRSRRRASCRPAA